MTFPEYSKIPSPYTRDNRSGRWNVGDWSTPELALLKDTEWVWTEKLDGTNVRIGWDGANVIPHGRTDAAQMPVDLMRWIAATITPEKCSTTFNDLSPECLAVIYGEGIGPKIQKGGGLYGELRVVIFDVRIGHVWLKREAVEMVADKLGVQVAPIVGRGSIGAAIDYVATEPQSVVSLEPKLAEGIVLRLDPELLDRRGHRIITKVKHADVVRLMERRAS